MESEHILSVKKVRKIFGGLIALKDVDLELKKNEILGLIGPNGAGKTTMFNVIAGALKADGGSITFDGQDITKVRTDIRCRLGIARTFQITKPFQSMDLIENVSVGAYFGGNCKTLRSAKQKAEEILAFIGMEDLLHLEAKSLSIGNRKKLELARALATEPKILLLDEVMGGLTPTERNEIINVIKKIRETGISIIMIEHVMKAVMSVSDKVVVLNRGEILAKGSPKEIVENPLVIEAYLGGAVHA